MRITAQCMYFLGLTHNLDETNSLKIILFIVLRNLVPIEITHYENYSD